MSTMASEAKTTGYKEQFIDLLNNKTKAREKGFTVLVKGRLELAEFKNLCREQMYNHCLTAHYKLNPETAVGTLLKAFLEDLTKIGRENPDTTGNFYPDPKTSFDSWGKRVEPILKRLMSLNEMTRNSFDRSMVAEIAGIVGNPKTLEKGDRLVLLAELESILDDPGEWAKFFELVFNNLPERVGIVISGVPDYYFLPTIEPHIIQLTLPPEEESPVPDKDSPTKSKFKTPSFLSDSAAAEDKLGVLDLASGMAKLVLHKETKPPLVIGIHGPWGKGKSTFMQLIDQQLAKEAAQDVVTVTFNAWQFEDSKQIWAGLAHVVSKKLESMMNPWYKFWMPIVHSFQKRKRELIINSGFLLLTVIVTVLIFIANPTILTGLDNKSEAVKLVKLVVAGGTPLLGFWILASKIKKLFQPINKKLMEYIRMPDYKDQMGFQHEVMRDLSMVEKYLRKQKPNCKTVIYIDDLDRCSEEKIMEILQANNLILANSNFFVFV
ncbi:MAG: hypothetical protein GY950_12775, partial [bacterium]|nr:hypothetical protein [bacterium]